MRRTMILTIKANLGMKGAEYAMLREFRVMPRLKCEFANERNSYLQPAHQSHERKSTQTGV